MSLAFRPVTQADQPLLQALYGSTRQFELDQVPWSPEQKAVFVATQFQAQTTHYEAHHPRSEHQIVLWEGEAVGRLWVDREDGTIHVLDLIISPPARGRGIGAAVLRLLQAEGATTGRPVTGYIEGWSPAARLLERLGFSKVQEEGVHHLFQWSPGSESN